LSAVQKSRITVRSCSCKLRAGVLFHDILNLWPGKGEFEICCQPKVYKRCEDASSVSKVLILLR
jgi:hypothetical protein